MGELNPLSPGWFRLLLASVVVVYHTTRYVFVGHWAVYVFFILSGYWLSELFRDKYQNFKHPLLVFYLSRFLRIYPVFFLCTLLALITNVWILEKTPPWSFANFRNWSPLLYSSQATRLLEPAWSLDIECQFYLLFPLLFYSLAFRSSVLLCIFALISAVSLFFLSFQDTFVPYLPFFCFGILISRLRWKPDPSIVRLVSAIAVTIVLSVYLLPESRRSIMESGAVLICGFDCSAILNVVLAILTIPYVAFHFHIKDTRVSRKAGNLSYPVYLVHWILLIPYIEYAGSLPFLQRLPWYSLYLAATFLISLAVYQLVDAPMESLRKRFIGRFELSDAAAPVI